MISHDSDKVVCGLNLLYTGNNKAYISYMEEADFTVVPSARYRMIKRCPDLCWSGYLFNVMFNRIEDGKEMAKKFEIKLHHCSIIHGRIVFGDEIG